MLALGAAGAATVLGGSQQSEAAVWSKPGIGAQVIPNALKSAEKTYPLRFVTYFSRFMLTYDTSSVNWWRDSVDTSDVLLKGASGKGILQPRLDQFARFAASAEVGLARYPGEDGTEALLELMLRRYGDISKEALKQICFLFALLDDCQPTEQIAEVLSRADNVSVSEVKVSSRGSGYTAGNPDVTITTPDYKPAAEASAVALLRDNGRVAGIKVTEGGKGYAKPPKIVFERTVAVNNETNTELKLELDQDQINQPFKPPVTEVVIDSEGYVVDVKVLKRGSGLWKGTYEWAFEAPLPNPKVSNVTEALEEEEKMAAKGTLVMDREIDKVVVASPGSGYSPAFPIEVSIQAPEECKNSLGLESPLYQPGERAVGTVALGKPKFDNDPVPTKAEEENLRFVKIQSEELAKVDKDLTSLIESSVGLSYQSSSKKFKFIETSALGFNVSTSFGPRARVPILKDDVISWSQFTSIGVAGGVCAAVAHGALVPLDTVKLKLQTAPPGKYDNIFDASVKVLRDEGGLKTFVNGFQPETLGSAIYGFLSFGGTEILRRTATSIVGPVVALQNPVPILVVSSCLASVVAAAISCPFQAVKVRMVADENYGPGANMIGGFQRLIREDGALALVQGVTPFLVKDVTFVLSKFSVFDVVSKAIYFSYPQFREDLQLTLLVSLVSGIVAGICAAVTSHPGDYLFSKANQKSGATVMSAWNDYMDKKDYGVILTGLSPRLLYGGLLIALQFCIYDYCRVLFHVSPGELNVFLDVVAGIAKSTPAQ